LIAGREGDAASSGGALVEDPLEVLISCGGMECVSLFRVDYEELEEVLGHGLFGGGWIAFVEGRGARRI
jgi:hypothetical protein